MAALIQLTVLVVLTAGLGYWFWLLLRQPAAGRALTWLWCGLAGFCLGMLVLQALVYADWRLGQTAPGLLLLAGVGTVLLLMRLWRARASVGRRRWREAGFILGAGLAAGLGHSTSLVAIGSDRFIGHAQIDQVSYVATAQLLVDEPFSNDLRQIGLRPWLWRAVDLKNYRLTECVVNGVVAVLARSDAQRTWGVTSVYFTALLALALAGMWRVAGNLPAGRASLLGLAGALLPVVSYVYLVGFFSQLVTLFVFPALIAICRPGALPRWSAFAFAVVLIGFLAGSYNEFWLIGASVAGGAILLWPVRFTSKVALGAGLLLGSLVLTSGFALPMLTALFNTAKLLQRDPTLLQGFAIDGLSWLGWGHNFVGGDAPWATLFGVLVAVGGPAGILLQPAHRRWHWVAALAGPGLLLAYLLLKAQPSVYATYKLLAALSPIALGCAAVAFFQVVGRIGPGARRVALALLAIGGVATAASAIVRHLVLVRQTQHEHKDRLDRLWAARDRAEANPGSVFLVENGNNLIGAWLAYFGRSSPVYYDLSAVADSRVPSEAAPFRKIPPGVPLKWLDLDLSGPVPPREPSLRLSLQGVRSSFEVNQLPVRVLGAKTELVLERAAGFAPAEKEFVLECGMIPFPGTGPCRVTLRAGEEVLLEKEITAATPLSIRFRAKPGRNVLTLQVRPVSAPAATDGDWLMLQALSLERAPTVTLAAN